MAWVKRNLGFLIGSVVALALMGMTGWYLYSKWQLNNEILDKLNEQYAKLQRLNQQNPHPGSGKINNVDEAKKQQQQLRAFIGRTSPYFQRISRIPDLPKISEQDFSVALSGTISRLQRDATNASVALPPKYSFSFEAERSRVSFDARGLEPLSAQLGEVKAICDVLCAAKINSLDALRRERVSADDATGPQSDYLGDKSVTNQLAVMAPYELSFRCFTPELASVLAGFASSPFGLLVKTINVEAAPAGTMDITTAPEPTAAPARVAAPPPRIGDRYGILPGGGAAATPQPTAPAAAPVARGGLPTVLDEKLLRVTMALNVVKLAVPNPK